MPLVFSLGINDALSAPQQGLSICLAFLDDVHVVTCPPSRCPLFLRLARIAAAPVSREPMWKGSGLPTKQQGIKVLGTSLGHTDFVAANLDPVLSDHRTHLERIPALAQRSLRVGTAPSHRSQSGHPPS